MYQITRIWGQDVFGYKELDLTVTPGVVTTIQGINNYDKGAENNGSGKSAIFDIVDVAIRGSFSRKDTPIVHIIRNGEDKCSLGVELKDTVTGKVFSITREFLRKSSSKLHLSQDGVDLSDKFPTVNDGNKLVFEILGISQEDFNNYYLVNREKYRSFFYSPDSTKRELISRFSKVSKIDGSEEEVLTTLKGLEGELKELEVKEMTVRGSISTLQNLIEKEQSESSLVERQEKELSRIDQEIERKKLSIVQSEESIKSEYTLHSSYIKKAEELELPIIQKETDIKFHQEKCKEVEENIFYNENFISDKEKELSSLQDKRKGYINEKYENDTVISQLQHIIDGQIECPNCHHHFVLGKEVSLEEAQQTLPLLQQENTDLEKKIETLNTSMEKVREGIEKDHKQLKVEREKLSEKKLQIKKLQSEHEQLKEELEGYKKKSSNCISIINQLREDIELFKDRIKSLEKNRKEVMEWTDSSVEKIASYKSDIKEKEKELKILDRDKKEKEKLYYEKKQWLSIFKKFRVYLTNQSIQTIQGLANHELKKMNSPLSLKIEGMKELTDGTVRDKITPLVFRDGDLENEPFGKFSAGERAKMDLAGSVLSLHNLINLSSPTGGLDFIFIDEILDSCDPTALSSIIEALSCLHKTIFLITHIPHSKLDCNNITVEKGADGISRIIN